MKAKNSYYNVLNFFIASFYIIIFSWVYFYVPLSLKDSQWIYFIPLAGLLTYPLWILIHEAIHQTLFSNKKWNDLMGKILCLYFGAPFRIVQAGHLLHHGYNRTKEDINDVYNPKEQNKFVAAIKYYYWLILGLYVAEFFSNFIWILPQKAFYRLKEYFKSRSSIKFNLISFLILKINEVRVEGFINTIFYAFIFYLYGEKFYVFVLFLLVRGFIISLMDNLFHYGTPANLLISGYNLKIPRIFQYILMNGNFHGLHHEKPKIPWYNLEKEFTKLNKQFDGPLLPQIFRQFKGPKPVDTL